MKKTSKTKQLDLDFSKIEKQIKNLNNRIPTIIVLGGSFSPVHNMHIHSFNVCKKYIDSLGEEFVISGYLIPATDKYIQKKLGEGAITLEHRNQMIELSINSSDWILNYPLGSGDALSAGNKIKETLETKYKELKNIKLRVFCGADNTLKTGKFKKETTVTIGRKGYTEDLKKHSSDFHKNFILIEDDSLEEMSSTLIRKMIQNKEEIDEKYMNKEVVKYLIDNKIY